jgi:hypothetical protein
MSSAKEKAATDQEIIDRLLEGSYHLPGYNYIEDLFQYLTNTHPLISIFLHHPLHPIGWGMRTAFLFGSIAFGLAVTNVIYLAFVMDNGKYDFDTSYYSASFNATITGYAPIDSQFTQINVTNGMIALWTVGGAMNALYDLTIWTVALCRCFQRGGTFEGKERLRSYLLIFVILAVVTGSTLAVLVRATYDSNEQTAEIANELELKYTPNAESYRFLIAYSVELVLSLFFWFFVVGFVMFSGVLGFTKVPGLGGRPQEVEALAKQKTLQCKKTEDEDDDYA